VLSVLSVVQTLVLVLVLVSVVLEDSEPQRKKRAAAEQAETGTRI
jgi:hypothetical protein